MMNRMYRDDGSRGEFSITSHRMNSISLGGEGGNVFLLSGCKALHAKHLCSLVGNFQFQ